MKGNILFPMIKKLGIILFLLVSFVFAFQDSLYISGSFPNAVGVFYPENIKSDNIFFVWFHGAMTSSNCEKGLIAGKDFFEIADTVLKSNVVVVSASACKDFHWLIKERSLFIDKTLDSLEKKWNLKIENVNLVGVSDGALGVLTYSFYGKRNVRNRLLVSSYLSGLGAPSIFTKESKNQKGSWTFFQGGNDRLYPKEKTFPWIAAFCKAKKIKCNAFMPENGEHDFSFWKKNYLKEIQAFIKRTKTP